MVDADGLERFSLRFRDRAQEAAYRESFTSSARAGIRFLWFATGIMWMVGGLWDFVVLPQLLPKIWMVRGVGAVIIWSTVAFERFASESLIRTCWNWVSLFGTFAMCLCIIAMQLIWPSAGAPFAYVALAFMGSVLLTLSTLDFIHSLAFVLACHALFVGALIARPIGFPATFNALWWLVSFDTFGILIARTLDRLRRRAFVQALALEREHERAERLLVNMLPPSIAAQLKHGSGAIAEAHPEVTVLFADIVGFTQLASRIAPASLVALLDRLFTAFDEIVERHAVEKIKTIGDAYMAVAGAPSARADHALVMAHVAFEMRDAVRRLDDSGELRVRIGIHSGPVVAGVIGKQKYTYDLWGDTVNLASRMESHGVADEVHVSQATAVLLEGHVALASRGAVDVKGKGQMQTYLARR